MRRDQVLEDQDYIEVFLDPLNTRRSATFFRVSARGILTDGQYDDRNRLRDYAPDFDFDAATVVDGEGWTAAIRIALASLRYRSGVENEWAYVVLPDFSQIEADAPQLTANTQFALAVIEKRPFFLEGTDLLSTQIPVIYTRAFTDPDAGVRITDRSSRHEYTALALRDAGGGTAIEPGPISSRLASQDFASNAFVARNRYLMREGSVGMLATARFNDDGSQNVVIGADGSWTPSTSNQLTAQVLTSQTRNPDRPDLLDVWAGQRSSGNAGALAWAHRSNDWSADLTYESYSRDFRAWNGFVAQVGMSSLLGIVDRFFYPDDGGWITRWGPQVTVSRKEGNDGERIGQWVSAGFVLRAAGDTDVTLDWYPRVDTLTLAGPRTYGMVSVTASSTPHPWMPDATVSAYGGEIVDNVTGATGRGFNVQATIPLRFARLEVRSTVGYQTSRGPGPDGATRRLFAERNAQVTATWHFSNRLNLRVMHQRASFDAAPPFANLESAIRLTSDVSSLLLSYQSNWQTRYYIGAVTGSDDTGPIGEQSKHTQVFAKLSYAFSR